MSTKKRNLKAKKKSTDEVDDNIDHVIDNPFISQIESYNNMEHENILSTDKTANSSEDNLSYIVSEPEEDQDIDKDINFIIGKPEENIYNLLNTDEDIISDTIDDIIDEKDENNKTDEVDIFSEWNLDNTKNKISNAEDDIIEDYDSDDSMDNKQDKKIIFYSNNGAQVNNNYKIRERVMLGKYGNRVRVSRSKAMSEEEKSETDLETYKTPNPFVGTVPKFYQSLSSYSLMASSYTTFVCNRCNKAFGTDSLLMLHKEECDEPPIDNIPTNIYGKHICPICEKKYTTDSYLGEHFIMMHSDYSQLSKLDEKNKIYYPSLDVIIDIGMIQSIKQSNIDKLICANETCVICSDDYKYPSSIEDGYSETERKRKTIPCITNCCNRHLCTECLINYIGYNNKLKCLYCNKDYEDVTNDYVITYEYSNITNDSWRNWWRNHIDIFFD